MLLTMNETDIQKQLKINKHRLEIIDALLRLYKHSNLIQTIKALSPNPKDEIMKRFELNHIQAAAIMDLRKPISLIAKEKILEEKRNLKKIETELKSIKS